MGRHCFVDINSLNFLFMYQVFTRYRVEIFVYGNGDNASFVLLGDSGAEPIGREVSELMDNYGEPCSFHHRCVQRQRPIIKPFITATYNAGEASQNCFPVDVAVNNKRKGDGKFQHS
ncbi:hypothetical protein YC2023_115797 [Brassica napus]